MSVGLDISGSHNFIVISLFLFTQLVFNLVHNDSRTVGKKSCIKRINFKAKISVNFIVIIRMKKES